MLSEEAFDKQFIKAREEGEKATKTEAWAKSAFYDKEQDQVVVCLTNGSAFSFSSGLAEGLADASPEDIAQVEVSPSGEGLHWDNLDVHFSVPLLRAGVYGTKRWMKQLEGKRGIHHVSQSAFEGHLKERKHIGYRENVIRDGKNIITEKRENIREEPENIERNTTQHFKS